MISPFEGKFKVTSPRGYRELFGIKEYHKGIDLVGAESAEIHAVADGECFVLYEENGFGNYIRQLLPDGRRIYYAHLKSTSVKSGITVKAGEIIGVMGATGKVTGTHLHLELRPAGFSYSSLDISEFTGIPNQTGTYTGLVGIRYSEDETVDALVRCGITTEENIHNWELMLSGHAPINRAYVRTLFDRCCAKIEQLQK